MCSTDGLRNQTFVILFLFHMFIQRMLSRNLCDKILKHSIKKFSSRCMYSSNDYHAYQPQNRYRISLFSVAKHLIISIQITNDIHKFLADKKITNSRTRIDIPRAARQAQMAGRSIVQFQLRELDAHQLAMAENAADEDTRTQANQTHRKGRGLRAINCIRKTLNLLYTAASNRENEETIVIHWMRKEIFANFKTNIYN